jgi:hypothetical protein
MDFSDTFQDRIDKLGKAIPVYAKAKADRTYIESFLHSKRAILMQSAPEEAKTISAKEAYAYAHTEYLLLLDGLKAAVEIEEKARWSLEKFKVEFEHWRTLQANDRWQKDRV